VLDDARQLRFDGRVAVVTGAGRGLGRAYARLLAARGASVVVNDLGGSVDGTVGDELEDPAAAVAEEIVASGGRAVANHGDVTSAQEMEDLVSVAVETFGRIDILVANAGMVRRGLFVDTSPEDFMLSVAVHQQGTFNACRAAWNPMAQKGYGRIVTTVSSALFGIESVSSYASAKGGVLGLSKVLSLEGGRYGIKVNMIAPVAFTRMTTSGPTGSSLAQHATSSLSPDRVAATVAVLAHELCPTTSEIYQASGSRVSRLFLGVSEGFGYDDVSPELLLAHWDTVMDPRKFDIPQPMGEGFMSELAGIPVSTSGTATRAPRGETTPS